MIERRSAQTGDNNNDETFTTRKKKREKNKSGISRLVNEVPVTTQEETLKGFSNKRWQNPNNESPSRPGTQSFCQEPAPRILTLHSKVDILINSTLEGGKTQCQASIRPGQSPACPPPPFASCLMPISASTKR